MLRFVLRAFHYCKNKLHQIGMKQSKAAQKA